MKTHSPLVENVIETPDTAFQQHKVIAFYLWQQFNLITRWFVFWIRTDRFQMRSIHVPTAGNWLMNKWWRRRGCTEIRKRCAYRWRFYNRRQEAWCCRRVWWRRHNSCLLRECSWWCVRRQSVTRSIAIFQQGNLQNARMAKFNCIMMLLFLLLVGLKCCVICNPPLY